MFDDLAKDIKYQVRTGGLITRVMVFCIALFLLLNLTKSYFMISDRGVDSGAFDQLLKYVSLSPDLMFVLLHPWVLISHFFVHMGLFHLIWNMVALYWFGRIVEDLIGSRHLKLVFFEGGIAGGLIFLLSVWLVPWMTGGGLAYGASAAVMAILLCAATISPNYEIRLLLIGPVSIKYLAAALIVLDVIFAGQNSNSGGRIAHLGGAMFGYLYVILLRNGISLDPMSWFNFENNNSKKLKKRKSGSTIKMIPPKPVVRPDENRLDILLDKIRLNGIDSLTADEKKELDQISQSGQ
ncbi:MAG: rhomboid family intramembrane serine protease [Saprospiraceae bacterium]|nr:rhomboid family intramembrane serine protease [Saprospiraceae bacterium]MBK7811043.1 rhomboid family intramembrane serine protease [Saprospiraceae bacterium]MBK9630646.1 rhomboid family intramembrane serine protease [Saprospiraceae bacterium]